MAPIPPIGAPPPTTRRRHGSARRTRRRVAIVSLVIVGAAVAITPTLAARMGDGDEAQRFTSEEVADAREAQAAREQAQLDQYRSAGTVASMPAVTTTVLTLPPVQAAPVPTIDRAALDAQLAQLETCRDEHAVVFTSIQAYIFQTNAIPDDPDRLVASGWLEPHPDGWSPRWQFDVDDAGLAVVPVPGGACDL